MFRRIHRIQIGKRGKFLIRKTGSQFIQKSNDTSRKCSFIIIYCFTGITCTISVITIILTHRHNMLIRICLKNRINPLSHDLKNFRVTQTPLARFPRMAFAFKIRIIFRMVFSIYGSRKQLIKSMHPITGSKHFIWLFQPVPPFIYGVCTNSITLCLAVTKSRIIYFIDKRQFDCLRRVKRVFVFSPIIHSKILFK